MGDSDLKLKTNLNQVPGRGDLKDPSCARPSPGPAGKEEPQSFEVVLPEASERDRKKRKTQRKRVATEARLQHALRFSWPRTSLRHVDHLNSDETPFCHMSTEMNPLGELLQPKASEAGLPRLRHKPKCAT